MKYCRGRELQKDAAVLRSSKSKRLLKHMNASSLFICGAIVHAFYAIGNVVH